MEEALSSRHQCLDEQGYRPGRFRLRDQLSRLPIQRLANAPEVTVALMESDLPPAAQASPVLCPPPLASPTRSMPRRGAACDPCLSLLRKRLASGRYRSLLPRPDPFYHAEAGRPLAEALALI